MHTHGFNDFIASKNDTEGVATDCIYCKTTHYEILLQKTRNFDINGHCNLNISQYTQEM